jgi:hypothetical protein
VTPIYRIEAAEIYFMTSVSGVNSDIKINTIKRLTTKR